MSTANGLKKQISQTIETLPESSLMEVATFLEYLQYRESLGRRRPATPYTPVALGGLWQGVTITDEDIDEVRREMMNTVQVSIELPRDVFSALRQDPITFVQEMRLAAAIKWYEMERVSQAKAAEIAGLSRAEFLTALTQFGVTPFQTTADELIEEVTGG